MENPVKELWRKRRTGSEKKAETKVILVQNSPAAGRPDSNLRVQRQPGGRQIPAECPTDCDTGSRKAIGPEQPSPSIPHPVHQVTVDRHLVGRPAQTVVQEENLPGLFFLAERTRGGCHGRDPQEWGHGRHEPRPDGKRGFYKVRDEARPDPSGITRPPG